MPPTLSDAEIRAAFSGPFRQSLLEGRRKEWKGRYLEYLVQLEGIKGEAWLAQDVQQTLWESNAITSVGPGSSVTVEEAYTDKEIAQKIREMKETPLPST